MFVLERTGSFAGVEGWRDVWGGFRNGHAGVQGSHFPSLRVALLFSTGATVG